MKNNILKTIVLLISLGALHACYKDEGNYDYSDINEVVLDTTDVDLTFTIDQFDTLTINPDITFSSEEIDDDQLEFKWIIYEDVWSKDEADSEVLSTKKNLKVRITQDPSSDPYAVMLYVTNKENNTVSQIKYDITIKQSIVSGMMVLHTNADGESDLDYIATMNAVPDLDTLKWVHDAYSSMNGEKIKGEPRFVSAARVNSTVIDYIYVGTDQSFLQISGTDFELLNQDLDLFKETPDEINVQHMSRGQQCNYVSILINDGQVHCINNQASQYWDSEFSVALTPSNSIAGAYYMAPYVYYPDDCAATTVGQSGVFYDTLNQRFVRLGFSFLEDAPLLPFPDQTSTKFDVNNIGKELIWMGKGYNGHCFAVFTDGSNRELYRADFNKASYTYDSDGNTVDNEKVNSLAVNSYDLSDLPEIYVADFYECGPLGNFFLYASDRNIYTYSYSSSNKVATQINDDFADDEVITAMKIYNTDWYSSLDEVCGTLLYVATYNGTEGKLYEFKINKASGRLNNKEEIDGVVDAKAPSNVFTGFGYIHDMCVKLEGED